MAGGGADHPRATIRRAKKLGNNLPKGRMYSLSRIICNKKLIHNGFRGLSSKGGLVDLTVDNEGIAVLTLQRPKVNSLNLELVQDISCSLDEVAKNKYKGMILTSSSSTVFSAGLDLSEMHNPDPKRIETFWTTLQDVWIKLFGSAYPTAAAVNGHSPAGGCLLAMSCEYRAMVKGKFSIGLNETALGIVPSDWFIHTMWNILPKRETEIALTTGKMFTVDEALKVGLIDSATADKTEAIEECKKFIKKFDKISPIARSITKQKLREGPLQWMEKNRQANLKEFLTDIQNPEVQKSLGAYLQNLKQRSAK